MKVALFPYDTRSSALAKYKELLAVDIEYYVYPSEIDVKKYNAEPFSLIDINKIKAEMTDEMLSKVDAICIVDSLCEIGENEILAIVSQGVVKGKKILLASYKYQKYKVKIQKICDENHVELIMYYNLNFDDKEIFIREKMEIDVPVITIMGMLPMTQKFDLQLYLRKHFLDKGYKVSQIGTRPISELFGFHAMPEFVFTNKYTDVDKIIIFNNFVKEIEKKEKPDVIIIGIPDVIIPFSKKHHFSFGIYAYEILSAIQPDFTFVNLSAGEYNQEFFDEISKMCSYKFNIDVDAFFISKFSMISTSLWSEELAFALVESPKIVGQEGRVFGYHNLKNKDMFELIESKLSRYGRFKQY